MDINAMLSQLRNELELLNAAIFALERLAGSSGRRRGRPPKWMAAIQAGSPETGTVEEGKTRRTFSPEARRRMAEAQRKRWAAQRDAAKGAEA